MTPLSDWTEADLETLIKNDVQESLTLDYKRSAALAKDNASRNELSKDVSAFANSAGGRIVYGVVEQDHHPRGIDAGCDGSIISREWIEQVISSTIQPRITGIVIKPISLASGGTAYVIDIPQATALAPHQAHDRRYYRRFNFESVAMHDYEVRDALRRDAVSQPDLWFEWLVDEPRERMGFGRSIKAMITNLSSEPILYASLNIFIDQSLLGPSPATPEGFELAHGAAEIRPQDGGPAIPLTAIRRNFSPAGHLPIFREQDWALFSLNIPIPPPAAMFHLGFDIRCPGAHMAHTGMFQFDGGTVKTIQASTDDLFRSRGDRLIGER